MKIIVATHNEGKLAEIRRILEECLGADAADIELVSAGSLGLPDPVEDGRTVPLRRRAGRAGRAQDGRCG